MSHSTDTVPDLDPLRKVTIFAGLDDAALRRLLTNAVRLEVGAG